VDGRLGDATEVPLSGTSGCVEATSFDNSYVTVALDLQTPLSQLGLIDGFYIVVEDVPAAVRLSTGRYNGDLSWSLAPGELDRVYATLPTNRRDAFVLSVRVLIPDPLGYEFASTAARFDVVISPDKAQVAVASRIEQNCDLYKSLPSVQEDRPDEERRLAAARVEWEAEAGARLERAWRKQEAERWSAREAELSAHYDAMLAAAEMRYRQQVVHRVAAAEAQWNARLAIIGARSRANTEHAPRYRKCAQCDRLRRLVIGVAALLGLSVALSTVARP
jgi:hypothetical protein